MNQDQLNTLCEAYGNVDGVTLHTDNPGNTGDYDSGIAKETLTWGTPITGVMSATAAFDAVPAGDYPYAGVWAGAVFIEAVPINLVTTETIPFYLTIEHHAKVR